MQYLFTIALLYLNLLCTPVLPKSLNFHLNDIYPEMQSVSMLALEQ